MNIIGSNHAHIFKINLSFVFSVTFRSNLTPRPTPTGQARKMVQNASKISPGTIYKVILWPFPLL